MILSTTENTLYQLCLKCKLFYKKTIIILNKKYIHKTP